jgi:hypothetical protein
MANQKISERTLKASVTGTEPIPVGEPTDPAITPALIAAYLGTWQTWTPTVGGFSADPTTISKYCLIGKLMFLSHITTVAGTSNATTYTLTLPPGINAITGRIQTIACGGGSNNSAGLTTTVRVSTASGSNVLSLFTNPTGAAWTASGTKSANFNCVIEID